MRNYDAQTGRWVQQDPYQEFATPYTYVGNDPVNVIDPSGGKTLPFFSAATSGLSTTAETAITIGEVIIMSTPKIASKAFKGMSIASTVTIKTLQIANNLTNIINTSVNTTQVGEIGPNPVVKSSYWEYGRTPSGLRTISVSLILEVNVKILDLALSEESKKFAKEFARNPHGFYTPQAFSEDVYFDYLPEGNDVRGKDGRMELIKIQNGAVPITVKAQIVQSEDEILDTDFVLVLAKSVTAKNIRGSAVDLDGYALGNVAVTKNFTSINVALHEIFHLLGLMDEYIKNPDGTFTSRYKDNLMDLQGRSLNSEQAAIIIRNVLIDIGKAKKFGTSKVYGGTKKDLKTVKTNNID